MTHAYLLYTEANQKVIQRLKTICFIKLDIALKIHSHKCLYNIYAYIKHTIVYTCVDVYCVFVQYLYNLYNKQLHKHANIFDMCITYILMLLA